MENIIIKPIFDLRTKLSEISKIVHETRKPIYLTKNWCGDMVLKSMDAYQDMMEENEIYF